MTSWVLNARSVAKSVPFVTVRCATPAEAIAAASTMSRPESAPTKVTVGGSATSATAGLATTSVTISAVRNFF